MKFIVFVLLFAVNMAFPCHISAQMRIQRAVFIHQLKQPMLNAPLQSCMARQMDYDLSGSMAVPFYKAEKEHNHLAGAAVGMVGGFLVGTLLGYTVVRGSRGDLTSASMVGVVGTMAGAMLGGTIGIPISRKLREKTDRF